MGTEMVLLIWDGCVLFKKVSGLRRHRLEAGGGTRLDPLLAALRKKAGESVYVIAESFSTPGSTA